MDQDLIVTMTKGQLEQEIRQVNAEIEGHISEAQFKRRWMAECKTELTRR